MSDQLSLPGILTVHCFMASCSYVEQGTDPDDVHDAMEVHYASRHRALIEAIAGGMA